MIDILHNDLALSLQSIAMCSRVIQRNARGMNLKNNYVSFSYVNYGIVSKCSLHNIPPPGSFDAVC